MHNGLRSKFSELRNFVIDNPVDLILVQEVRADNFGDLSIKNFKSYFALRYVTNNIILLIMLLRLMAELFVSRRAIHDHTASLILIY